VTVHVTEADAAKVRALADKMHELFLDQKVDKFTVFCAMGTCIAETYKDPELIEDALRWVRYLATDWLVQS
jgi:hypothetical protein